MPIPHLKIRKRVYGEVEKRRLIFRPRLSWIKKIIWAGLIFTILAFIGGTIAIAIMSRDLPDPNKLNDRKVAQSTKIYDRTGTHLLYEIYQNQKRTMVELEQISSWVPKAVVAIEDKHFYEHRGIRYISILRALVSNLTGRSTGSGGASTITQQLIKNAIIGNNPSFFQRVIRKFKEMVLAPRLEKKYTKDQILKMYLNEIPFGSTNYGIESASQSYLKKNAKDLTLSEAAALAAMIQAPTHYLNNPDELKNRRDYVLNLMAEQGMITADQKTEAQNDELKLTRNISLTEAPHFVMYITQQLVDKYGEVVADTGGLKIITSLDYDKQKIAEETVTEMGAKFASSSNANNAALVSIDPKTAQILAMVGSRDYNDETIKGNFNVAVDGKRQPGSSLKPFVYTAAFEKGYTPETVLYDTITNFDQRTGGKYIPKNYDGKEHGLVTMRKALQGSLNIPAVKTLYLVGTKPMVDFFGRFGYTTFTKEPDLTMVLGGNEITLLEHTNAYATLANNGVYHKPVSILKITAANGEVLEEWKPESGTEAVKSELAALISNVLSDNAARAYIFGLHSSLTLPDRPVATKTGTTNDYKDAWTMGYVPSLATGVWVGNTIPSTMKGGGDKLAGQIWNQFMQKSLKNIAPETFPSPPPNDSTKPVLRGADGGIILKINRFTGKIAASTTPENLVVEKTFLPPHDILYYVNKDDPRGANPTNPESDPQYFAWESGVASWVENEKKAGREIVFEEPPTEMDPPQSPELVPTLSISSPVDGSTLSSRQLDIRVVATAPRGVAQIIYFIDDLQIGTITQFPFDFSYHLQTQSRGEHTLRALAQDDLGNSADSIIKFNLDVELDSASAEWFDKPPLTLTSGDFPRAMFLTPFRWKDTKDVKIYLTTSGEKKLIYTFTQTDELSNGKLIFTWNHAPSPGDHTLSAKITDTAGKTTEKELLVRVGL